MPAPRFFTRDDGAQLRVVEGFADEVISRRPGRTPRASWARATTRWLREDREAVTAAGGCIGRAWGGHHWRTGARSGLGSGLDSLVLATRPVELVAGVDLALPLFEPGPLGQRFRRLTRMVLALANLPISLVGMDARELPFETDSFDLVFSGACLAHVRDVEVALAEMARVLRPGGRMYHRIDPFFWVRGCHGPGLVDIPWAHAGLTPPEYLRFLVETQGSNEAVRRFQFVESLNQFTVRRWWDIFASAPVELIDWEEERLIWVVELLARHLEAIETTIECVEPSDLACSMITAVAAPPRRGGVRSLAPRLARSR